MVTSRLAKTRVVYEIFDDVIPDPPIGKVIAGVQRMVAFSPDCLVAIGGGSAIDLAKGVRKFASEMDPRMQVPMFAIPTTSGTGSEVTSFAVITDETTHSKYPLSAEDMIPDEAILDEELVRSVPATITADTGMDVMTHAIEAYVSINNNEFSGALAEKSVEICGQFLLRSWADNNDTHARRKMHIASCLAGLAFNSASLGLNHGMAHQLGAVFHIPHGRANAILLPHIIEYNSRIDKFSRSSKQYAPCVQKYCNMARILGVNNLNEVTTIRALVAYIQFMGHEMGIPSHISEFGSISEGEYIAALEEMARGALLDGCTATNPRVPTMQEVVDLYRAIW
jgi:alcohol dehydrogenase class IV